MRAFQEAAMRKTFVAVLAALVLGWAAPSRAADVILFDPDGSTGPSGGIEIASFDWAPGNSLLVENGDGTGTIYYQASLTSLNDAFNTPVYTPTADCGAGDACYFTAVAAFGVTITQTTIDPDGIPNNGDESQVNTFAFLDTDTNFLKIYADTVNNGDDLAGTGFTDGTLILDAEINGDQFSSSFFVPDLEATDDLDNHVSDDYPTVDTIVGSGGTSLKADVNTLDTTYFLTTLGTVNVVLTNTSQKLPYAETDPSHLFSSDGMGGTICGADCVGTLNGGPLASGGTNSTVSQADANTSFEVEQVTEVPEPASLLLLGSGLLGAAAARRRRSKKN
jgi:PEP-CTERM motif